MLYFPRPKNEVEAQKVSAICAWIDANLDQKISLIQLVEQSGMPYQELIQLFNTHKATTPMQWIRARRDLN